MHCLAFFFFNDTATTEIYTLSLHDALPISWTGSSSISPRCARPGKRLATATRRSTDRKSTRLNSSHGYISYAVFCLKKKKKLKSSPASVGLPTPDRPFDSPLRAGHLKAHAK